MSKRDYALFGVFFLVMAAIFTVSNFVMSENLVWQTSTIMPIGMWTLTAILLIAGFFFIWWSRRA